MVFIGFGLLYTSLKSHQWSSVLIVLLVGVISLEISFCWNCLWRNSFVSTDDGGDAIGWHKLGLDFENLVQIEYIASTVLISLGSLIGRLSIIQYLFIAIFETFFSSLNFYLCYEKLGAVDNGGSLYIHMFGAIFGVMILLSTFCSKKEKKNIENNPHLGSDYYSNIIASIGTLFLWLYFPSFNVAYIQRKRENKEKVMEIFRYRGIINTYLSMIGSTMAIFVITPIVSNGKLKMEYILNGSYVGGIIIGGSCTICSSAWSAILIGFIAGCIVVILLWKVKKCFRNLLLEDTFGILHTFGIPGLLGGFLNSIFMGNFTNEIWGKIELKNFFNFDRNPSEQGGIQIAAIFITLGISVCSGICVGFIVRTMNCDQNKHYFVDSEFFVEDEIIPFPENKYPKVKIDGVSSSEEKTSNEDINNNKNNKNNVHKNNINNKKFNNEVEDNFQE
jgi:ammonium transporter Rh